MDKKDLNLLLESKAVFWGCFECADGACLSIFETHGAVLAGTLTNNTVLFDEDDVVELDDDDNVMSKVGLLGDHLADKYGVYGEEVN